MMNLPTYTLKMELLFDERKLQDFMIAITDAINGMEKPILKTKTKIKKHKKYFTIKVKVKFIDGTKMVFKNKYELDITGGIVALTPEEIAEAYGQMNPKQQKQENKIGFQLD